ncbi:hypothetical protein [Leucobacter japonicus]|uniref:hypothetical protein n=1 Tax=Leucobacter japonicus TaxID=1461259 RepID=UPI0006A79567|nr:hypothetical protein [Leucobacter japonicus]
MSDVGLVSLISATATVLVAALGVVSAVFGPLLVERLRRGADRRDQEWAASIEWERLRNERAFSFMEALTYYAGSRASGNYIRANQAASGLIASLGTGNQEAVHFIRVLVNSVRDAEVSAKAIAIANDGIDRLYAWLRSDADLPTIWDPVLK